MTREELYARAYRCRVGLKVQGADGYQWLQPLRPVVQFSPYLKDPIHIEGYGIIDAEGQLIKCESFGRRYLDKYCFCNGDTFNLDMSRVVVDETATLAELFEGAGEYLHWQEVGF